jgi:hypothetical protein
MLKSILRGQGKKLPSLNVSLILTSNATTSLALKTTFGLPRWSCWPPCAVLTQAARLHAGISKTAIPAQDHAPSLSGLLRIGPY